LLRRTGAFWSADYFDRYIRTERHHAAALDHIENIPVKAGLTERAELWPWSSARRRRLPGLRAFLGPRASYWDRAPPGAPFASTKKGRGWSRAVPGGGFAPRPPRAKKRRRLKT